MGLAPTGKRRLITAHTHSGPSATARCAVRSGRQATRLAAGLSGAGTRTGGDTTPPSLMMAHPLALILRSVVNLNYASRALRSGLQRHAICNATGITSFFARTINRSATLLLIICAFSHNWHGRGHTWGADERNRYDFGGSRSVCRNDKDRDREKTDRHEDSVRLSRPIATSSSSYDRSVVHRICYARGMINPPLIHRIRRFTHVSSRLREAKKGNQTCDTPYPAPELFGSVFPSSSALSRPLFRSAPPSPNPCQPP